MLSIAKRHKSAGEMEHRLDNSLTSFEISEPAITESNFICMNDKV